MLVTCIPLSLGVIMYPASNTSALQKNDKLIWISALPFSKQKSLHELFTLQSHMWEDI